MNTINKNIPLYLQILLGLLLGLSYSILATVQGWVNFTEDWISPFGKIFIKSLKLIAVPLVLVSLIVGVASMNNIKALGKMGGKSIFILWFCYPFFYPCQERVFRFIFIIVAE